MSVISIGVSNSGFYRDRLDDIKTKLEAGVKGIYGSDSSLDPATPDGQIIGIIAECADDEAQALEDVYNGRDPRVANGQNLTAAAALNGVYREVGDYSYVDVAMTTSKVGAVMPAGLLVQDEDTGATYALVTSFTSTGGTVLATFKAVEKGSVSSAGKVTKIVNPTYGLASVTNPDPSTTVTAEETDEQLRIRRNESVAAPTSGFLDSIRAGVLAVAGVGKVKVHENDTGTSKDVKSGDQALAPHSVAVLVTGGSASAIGAAIYARKTPGLATVGTSEVAVNDSLGIPHVMRYTVATEVPYFVKVLYKERPGSGFGASGGEVAVAAALKAWSDASQLPSEDVYRFFHAAIAQNAVIGLDGLPAIVVEDLQLGFAAETVASTDLILIWNQIGTLLAENVAFEVVA